MLESGKVGACWHTHYIPKPILQQLGTIFKPSLVTRKTFERGEKNGFSVYKSASNSSS